MWCRGCWRRLDRGGPRTCEGCGAPWSPEDLATWAPQPPPRTLPPLGRFLAWGLVGVLGLVAFLLPWAAVSPPALAVPCVLAFVLVGSLGALRHASGFAGALAVVPAAIVIFPSRSLLLVTILGGPGALLFLAVPLLLGTGIARGLLRHHGYRD